MSYTEIYGFGESGKVEFYAEIKNAFRGAMAVWRHLEEKYLPSLPKPPGFTSKENEYWTRTMQMFEENSMSEIWGLFETDKLSYNEKIVLGTTFDRVIVEVENAESLLEAFRNFGGDTSLKEQATAIESMLQKGKLVAIGFNQTSVNGDTWANYHYNEETEESESYNILENKDHWFLFKELARQEAEPDKARHCI